jgi:Glycosyltransferase 61
VITFQRKRANRRIVNEEEFIKLLETYAPVNVVEFNSSHSFAEQLSTVSKTGVFISVWPHLLTSLCNCTVRSLCLYLFTHVFEA